MNYKPDSSTDRIVTSLLLKNGLVLLVLLVWLIATAQGQDQGNRDSEVADSSTHAKHVLGFDGIRRNASGDLSIQDDRVRFQRNESPAAEIPISSIRNISLGTEDKQVGACQ